MDFIVGYKDEDMQLEADPRIEKLCEICQVHIRLYKCPRCYLFTCSLECCKQHKVEKQCSGRRDRVEYIPVSNFDDNHLRNDYHFLEDILQSKLRGKRALASCGSGSCGDATASSTINKKQKHSNEICNLQHQGLPKNMKKLISAAAARHITLVTMPQGMSKRRINTTRYVEKADLILWRLHFVFILDCNFELNGLLKPEDGSRDTEKKFIVQNSLLRLAVTDISEDVTIKSVINSFHNSDPANALLRHAVSSIRKANQLHVCMQKLPTLGGTPKFVMLNIEDTIKVVLTNSTVIEYPTIIVGSSQHTNKIPMFIRENNDALCTVGIGNTIVSVTTLPDLVMSDDTASAYIDSVEDEGYEGKGEDEIEFLDALKELEGKDVAALRDMLLNHG